MIQTIQIAQVLCDHEDHQDQQITSLCTRSQCKEKSACCQKCVLKFHRDCHDQIAYFNEVPRLARTIQNLETVYQDLVSQVSQVLKDIKRALDSLLLPIKVYQDSPNLGNLNRLGDLLRSHPTSSVPQLIGQTQKVISDELTNLLLSIQQMEPIRYSEKQEQEAQKLFKECKQWFGQDWTKALDCIERAIQLVPNNEEYWDLKGSCLWQLDRYYEAIESWNKNISIKPTRDAYYSKSYALLSLNRFEEAIYCLEEGLRQFPDDEDLISYLNYLNQN